MIRLAYIFLLTGIFCVLELILRNFGLFFPFCALFVFYIATAFGTGWGIATACLGALALDSCGSGASHPWSILIFIAAVLFASIWLHQAEADSILMNFLPGLLIPFPVWLLSGIFFSQHFFTGMAEQFPTLFPVSAFSAIWLPIMIFLLDTLNTKLSLPLYTDAKTNLKLKLK